MERERFAEEFREAAARQVIERGYSVVDVPKGLGVSAQSLYRRFKAAKLSAEYK